MSKSFGGTIKLTGESEYRKALTQITSDLKVMSSQMQLCTAIYGKQDSSVSGLTDKNKILNDQIAKQKEKVEVLKNALDQSKQEYGENSTKTNEWQVKLNKAQAELVNLNKELDNNNKALGITGESTKTSINSLNDFTAVVLRSMAGTENFGKVIKEDITQRLNDSNLVNGIKNTVDGIKSFGENVNDSVNKGIKGFSEGVKSFGEGVVNVGKSTADFGNTVKNEFSVWLGDSYLKKDVKQAKVLSSQTVLQLLRDIPIRHLIQSLL